MTTTSHQLGAARLRRLQWALRIGAATMILFFAFAAVNVLIDNLAVINENASTFGRLAAWSDSEGHEYVLMMSAIYIVWGAYVWAAAKDPVDNRLMVEFTIVGNFAHMAVMALMAILDPTHTAHLLGDVPLGLLLPITLTILWLPVRRSLPANEPNRPQPR